MLHSSRFNFFYSFELKRESSCRGQALLEFIPLAIVLFPLLFGLVWTIGVFFSFFWIDYWAYESVLCLAQQKPRLSCQQNLEQKIKLGSIFVDSIIQSLYASTDQAQVKIKLQGKILTFPINKIVEHKVSLPLIPR